MKKISKRKRKRIERTVANDRSYKLFLYNRVIMYLALILLQIIMYVGLGALLVYNSSTGVVLQMIIGIIALLMVLYLINKSEKPALKLSWILLILIVPFVGVPSYSLYGEGRPTRLMNRKIQRAHAENRAALEEVYGVPVPKEATTRGEALERYLTFQEQYPAFHSGEIEYFECGEKMFPEMLKALESAEKYILVEYFIIAHGKMWAEILKILLEKAEAGVQIRILYDDIVCITTLPPRYDKYLESLHENIRCMSFNKVVPMFAVRMNNRDHRKILVIDGKTAFTGGINLADEYIAEKVRFGYWKDAGIKITGESVRSFVDMFFYMWNAFRKDKEDIRKYLPVPEKGKEGGRDALNTGITVQPYDDSPLDSHSVGETVYIDIISRATRYVYIFTPYLILDDFLRSALCQAAMRGVDVRIVTPGTPDKKVTYRITRANYEALIKAGVKIYEYTPGFIHAKCMVSDDECAVVGSINLDYRSLYLHFENAVYFSGCDAVLSVKRDCEETFALSKPCTLETHKRSTIGKLIDAVLRIFESLF